MPRSRGSTTRCKAGLDTSNTATAPRSRPSTVMCAADSAPSCANAWASADAAEGQITKRGATTPSPSWACSASCKPTTRPVGLLVETITNWRAGCGRSACPVRREGRVLSPFLPLSRGHRTRHETEPRAERTAHPGTSDPTRNGAARGAHGPPGDTGPDTKRSRARSARPTRGHRTRHETEPRAERTAHPGTPGPTRNGAARGAHGPPGDTGPDTKRSRARSARPTRGHRTGHETEMRAGARPTRGHRARHEAEPRAGGGLRTGRAGGRVRPCRRCWKVF